MKSFKAFTHHKPDIYLYYSFDLKSKVDLSILKSRSLHGYFYSKKTNSELLKYNMTLAGNWNNALLVCKKEKVLKENPNMQSDTYLNSDIFFNTNDEKALLSVIIPKKSILVVLVPDAQLDAIKEGKKTDRFFDFSAGSVNNISNSITSINKYGLDNIYDIRFARQSDYVKSTRAILQQTLSFSVAVSFLKGNNEKV